MSKLFWYMMKEEWRIHSTMFGSLSFALFPIMIGGMAFMGSFLLPLIRASLPSGNLSILLHSNYLLLGFMVGAFGLLGNEAMNRRFGQASLIAHAVRTLPLSDRYIFTTFVLKDTCYYFILWVLPFAFGFLLASPFIGLPIVIPILLTITLTLSFLTGLSVVFFLSTMYGYSKPILGVILAIFAIGILAYIMITGSNPALLFPPVMLLHEFSWLTLIISCLIVVVLFFISIRLFVPETSGTSKKFRNQLLPLTRRLKIFPYPILAAKDIIDLYRSGGAIGQTLFSFLIPLVVIWFFLSLTSGYLPIINLLFVFAITTGVIASTMYTWLTAFDSYNTYSCLPVSVKTLIISKISSFTVLQLIPAIFIAFISLISGQILYIIPVIVLCLSTSFFALSVIVWLAGLSPNVLVYDIKVMIRYFFCIGIAASLFSSLAFTNPWLALTSILLALPAWILIKRGFIK
ncbi:MAG: hypothetical protein V1862_03585, partial [Methanobacteriota archaeon]